MANESIYVAIGIACVVTLLLFTFFVIYCVKRQQEKEQTRLERERRAREERHRRHLMRAHIVRPPPYDPQRQNAMNVQGGVIPYSPPPEYKEVATPVPPRNHRIAGIGGVTYNQPPDYTIIPTVSRNVAPANTQYGSNNFFSSANENTNNNGNNRSIRRGSNYNNNNSNNIAATRNLRNSTENGTIQARPISVTPTTVVMPSNQSNSYSNNVIGNSQGNGNTNTLRDGPVSSGRRQSNIAQPANPIVHTNGAYNATLGRRQSNTQEMEPLQRSYNYPRRQNRAGLSMVEDLSLI